MATGGRDNNSDEEVTTNEEDEDQQWTYFDDEGFDDLLAFQTKKLQMFEDVSTSVVDQPGTSSEKNTKDMPKKSRIPLSGQFVVEHLMSEYKVEKQTAQAAVQSQGRDIATSLQWIDRNRFNFALLEEKAKEYEYNIGMISELDMMEWVVKRLTSSYGIVKEVAMAAVQIKGCQFFGECRRCAKQDGLDAATVLASAKEYDKKIDFLKKQLRISKLSVARGYDDIEDILIEKQAHEHQAQSSTAESMLEQTGHQDDLGLVFRAIPFLCGVETYLKWVRLNQHDEKKLQRIRNLCAESWLKQKVFGSMMSAQHEYNLSIIVPLWFGEQEIPTPAPEFTSETYTEHAMLIADLCRAHPYLLYEFPGKQSFRWREREISKKVTVEILSDFMPEHVAKAAVLIHKTDLDECVEWAEQHENDEENIMMLSAEYNDQQRKWRKMQNLAHYLFDKIVWSEEATNFDTTYPMLCQYKLCHVLAETMVQTTSSTYLTVLLKQQQTQYIKNKKKVDIMEQKTIHCLSSHLYEAFQREQSEMNGRGMKRMKEADWKLNTIDAGTQKWDEEFFLRCQQLAVGAVRATSSSDFDICREWIMNEGRLVASRLWLPHGYHSYKGRQVMLQEGPWQEKILPRVKKARMWSLPEISHTNANYPRFVNAPVTSSVRSHHAEICSEKNEEQSKATSPSEEKEFLQIPALKGEKAQKVGPGGGEISLQEHSIFFPEGAVKEEKEFNVTLDNDPKKFPSFSIPITSILGCRPSMKFDKPVTVKMRTCYSAIGNAEITATLYQREDDGTDWIEVQKVTLTSKNQVQFDVMHFSDDVVGVSEGTQGEFHLINDVYIKKDTGVIASIFFVDQGAHDLATEDMRNRGVVPMLMKPKEIITKMSTEITVAMECRRPNGAAVAACNALRFKITPEFLKKRGHEIYYELEQLPQDYAGNISIRYTLKTGDEPPEILPLTTSWPIVLPEKQVLQIGNVSIDSRTNIRGNIVSAGTATTSIESHEPVYHMGSE